MNNQIVVIVLCSHALAQSKITITCRTALFSLKLHGDPWLPIYNCKYKSFSTALISQYFPDNVFWRMGVFEALKDFAGQTSIHGFGYLVDRKSTVKTRCFWSLVLFTLIMYASLQLRIAVFCKFLYYKLGK